MIKLKPTINSIMFELSIMFMLHIIMTLAIDKMDECDLNMS